MKTSTTLLTAVTLCLLTGSAMAQEREELKSEVVSVKKEIRKEVRMEEENGVKTLTISTEENGNKTEEIYVGEEAEKKMAEMVPEMESAPNIEERVEVNVEKRKNDKKVTITRTSNGNETIEVYEGEEAEQKLKELESETATEFEGNEKKIIVEKKEVKRSKKTKKPKKKDVKE
jgi:hypothetical protein